MLLKKNCKLVLDAIKVQANILSYLSVSFAKHDF